MNFMGQWLIWAARKAQAIAAFAIMLVALAGCQQNVNVNCNYPDFVRDMQTGELGCDSCVEDYVSYTPVTNCWGLIESVDTGSGGDSGGEDSDTQTDTDTGTSVVDFDGDGIPAGEDCDDGNAGVTTYTWYIDYDGDGYGSSAYTDSACEMPAGYVATADDCNDTESEVNPAATEVCDGQNVDENCDGLADDASAADATYWFVDGDGDGYGSLEEIVEQCDAPSGYAATADDCDDDNNTIHPEADESDCSDPVDYNCDGSTGYEDGDGDGVAACEDCDDSDAAQQPGASETCNDEDDDCDGTVDENDATDVATWYYDDDGDGYGIATATIAACDAPAGYAAVSGDCDDSSTDYHPGATEDCEDPTDYNCDGSVGYADADGDGSAACVDCDDTDEDAFPGADEVCDNVDNDCDGSTDEASALDAVTWYLDADSDGYGKSGSTTIACDQPSGYAANATDCDDADADAHPYATESCDGTDEDCDGYTDENDASDATTWYRDNDLDGYGSSGMTQRACDQPEAYVAVSGDCQDSDEAINPSADEVCDEVDNDCDGDVDSDDSSVTDETEWYLDEDDDGYGDPDASTLVQCDQPSGYANNGDDCNDNDEDEPATEACAA